MRMLRLNKYHVAARHVVTVTDVAEVGINQKVYRFEVYTSNGGVLKSEDCKRRDKAESLHRIFLKGLEL